ncbi:MAG: geranylgeranylglyceryl/heptaprenylglyceryl phosphate synthase [Candidatus Aenigmarchaeota archaeon]|nr:geranylgeranylglyceryl/heptaprenylglyceryl phosphate synthase [Candidatus Aenigmarchaeota archaeon]
MAVKDFICKTIRKRAMHVTLLDPDPKKMEGIDEKIKQLKQFGTDAFLVGGSTNVNQVFLDKLVLKIKNTSLPVILFPGGLSGISKYADAIFFMSLLNSKDPYWITGAQAQASVLVKKLGIEIIPMAYLIVEPGMRVGEVGKADLIKRDECIKAAQYALAAQHLGMSLVYLEAGSGAPEPVPTEMVKAIKKTIDIPLIVGGGIRKPVQAKALLEAGADIIDTGTITEENFTAIKSIIEIVKNYKK